MIPMPCRVRALAALALGLFACGKDAPAGGESSSTTTGGPQPVPCDMETPCPEPQVCLVGICHDGEAPVIDIVTPAEEAAIGWNDAAGTSPVEVVVQATGLELVAAAMDSDSERGRGQIVIALDGIEVATLDTGDIAAGVGVTLEVPSEPGPHRLHAEARLSDGRTYDNPEAVTKRFFWFDDGVARVAFKSPVPGEVFPPKKTQVEFSVATLNFQLAPAGVTAQPGAIGHAHVLVDKSFPACAGDAMCRDDYLGVLVPANMATTTASAAISIPATADESTSVTAYLVRTNHEPYCAADPCEPVWETIVIGREQAAADTGADTGGTTTGGDTTTGTTGTTVDTNDCGGFIATTGG